MIPRFKPNYNHEEIISLINNKENVIKSFEEKFANLVNSKYSIVFPSGRSGLFSILKSLNISKSEVVIPSYSCIVVPPPIMATGNIPCFVDISLYDYNIKINEIPKIITEKTNAIIPTHMYGNPLDIKKIRDIIGEKILIIEDAAQAILSKEVGKYGDAVFYSFNFEKQIFTFGGGVVTTNNEEIFEKLILFRKKNFQKTFTRTQIKNAFLLLTTPLIFSNYLFKLILSYYEIHGSRIWEKNNWNLSNYDLPVVDIYLSPDSLEMYSKIQAAVGLAQLNKIKKNIENRIKISKIYHDKLKDIKNFVLSPIINGSSYSHYTLRIKNRNKLERYMKHRGLQVNKVFDYSLPHLPVYNKYVKKGERFPNSFIAAKKNVNLPTYPQLLHDKQQLDHIVKYIIEYDEKLG